MQMNLQVRVATVYLGKMQNLGTKFVRHTIELTHLQFAALLCVHDPLLFAIHHFRFDEQLGSHRLRTYLPVRVNLLERRCDHLVDRALQRHTRVLSTHGLLQQLFVKLTLCIYQCHVVREQRNLLPLTQVGRSQFCAWKGVFQCC